MQVMAIITLVTGIAALAVDWAPLRILGAIMVFEVVVMASVSWMRR